MSKTRLEAFTDAVVAIILTILVLELHSPVSDSWHDLFEIRYKLLIYVVSFVSLCIYWNNHHHLFKMVHRIDGRVLWANNFFILTLSLFPFVTAWVGDFLYSWAPEAVYGLIFFIANTAYFILVRALTRVKGQNEEIKYLYHHSWKMYLSTAGTLFGLLLGYFIAPILVLVCNVAILLLWIIPERKVEAKYTK